MQGSNTVQTAFTKSTLASRGGQKRSLSEGLPRPTYEGKYVLRKSLAGGFFRGVLECRDVTSAVRGCHAPTVKRVIES